MRQRRQGRAAIPLRTALVILLLAGVGFWQAWHCAEGLPAPQMALSAAGQVQADQTAKPGYLPRRAESNVQIPLSLAIFCVSVLDSFAALFLLGVSPLRLLKVLRSRFSWLSRALAQFAQNLALTQLCVSRT